MVDSTSSARGSAPPRPDWRAQVRTALYRHLRLSEASKAEGERIRREQLARDVDGGFARNPYAKPQAAHARDEQEWDGHGRDFEAPAEIARDALLAAAFEAHGLSPRCCSLDRPVAILVDGFVVAIHQETSGEIVAVLVQPSDVLAPEDLPASRGPSKKGRE